MFLCYCKPNHHSILTIMVVGAGRAKNLIIYVASCQSLLKVVSSYFINNLIAFYS